MAEEMEGDAMQPQTAREVVQHDDCRRDCRQDEHSAAAEMILQKRQWGLVVLPEQKARDDPAAAVDERASNGTSVNVLGEMSAAPMTYEPNVRTTGVTRAMKMPRAPRCCSQSSR